MAKQRRDYSTGFTFSRGLSILTRLRANQLVLLTALSSKGALLRTIQTPGLRFASVLTGWWSRSWIGQVLGIALSVAIFRKGFGNDLDPAAPGDEWESYKEGQFPKPKR